MAWEPFTRNYHCKNAVGSRAGGTRKCPSERWRVFLKRRKPTIFREIKRNFWSDDAFPKKYAGYFGHAAQLQTNKRTKPAMGKIMKAVRDLAHLARKSITFDRGTEFVSWPHLQAEIGTQTWFCDCLNATPRKCLGWKTPAEVFREKMMAETGQRPYPKKE